MDCATLRSRRDLVPYSFCEIRKPCQILDLVDELSRALFHLQRHRLTGSGRADALSELIHNFSPQVIADRAEYEANCRRQNHLTHHQPDCDPVETIFEGLEARLSLPAV